MARDADRALAAIAAARKASRAHVWAAARADAPSHEIDERAPLVIDLDATLVSAHSEKEQAAPTYKRGFGLHPLCAFVDHGPAGTAEALAVLLRPGNAGSNTAADHISLTPQALAAVPGIHASRPGRKVLIRTDSGGGTHAFMDWLARRGLQYSIGFVLPADIPAQYAKISAAAWTPAYDPQGRAREGADVAHITGLLDLNGYPDRMRVIIRRERPHPGAQLPAHLSLNLGEHHRDASLSSMLTALTPAGKLSTSSSTNGVVRMAIAARP
ncbi:transposase [Mobilicoccus sp.]|uniref:transposase n=1 Tax=Mobilicoccus sp. TaxID=2034349 RepID=UPI0037CAB11F